MKIKKGEGLNIVPFIDIMLVLLAIVLSISTLIPQSQIPIDVPKASSSTLAKNEQTLAIIVNAKNQIFVDKQEYTPQTLGVLIDSTPSETLIELKSDKESKFDTFVQILNLLKERNRENFTISTQKN